MKLLDLTLDTPAENLALDEALLEEAEADTVRSDTERSNAVQAGPARGECLRLWESPRPVVIVGRGSKLEEEVNLEHCRRANVPILRRTSGGAAIVAGPGCLMYSVVFDSNARGMLSAVDQAHRFVLDSLVRALSPLVGGVARRGTSDLALDEKKFSGNSLRVKRRHVLYHGTLLYDFDLMLIEQCLTFPPRVPEYRQGRSHREFVGNLPLTKSALCRAVIDAFGANTACNDWPLERTKQLVNERYNSPTWNAQR